MALNLNTAKELLKGVGQGFTGLYKDYGKLLGEASTQVGRFATNPLYRRAILNPGSFNAEDAAKLNKYGSGAKFFDPKQILDKKKIALTGGQATGKALLATYGLGAGPGMVGGSAALGGGLTALFGGNANEVGQAIGKAPLTAGFGRFSRELTFPFMGKIAPGLVGTGAGQRVAQGIVNAAEGVGFDVSTGAQTTPLSLLTDFGVGALSPYTGKPVKANFKLDDKTLDELIVAERMVLNPDSFIGKVKTSSRDIKDARKEIQAMGAETIDRISGKHLPNKQLNTLKTVEAKARALFDLNRQNKLANMQGPSYFADTSKTTKSVQQPSTGGGGADKPIKINISNESQRLNVNNLDLDPQQRQMVRELENKLSGAKDTLKFETISELADVTLGSNKAISTKATAQKAAEELATRRNVTQLAIDYANAKESGASEKELRKIADALYDKTKVARSQGTDVARRLSARKILASKAGSPMQKVFMLLDQAGVKKEDFMDEAVKIDWDNADEVVKFYRSYVPASWGDTLDEFRYNNMLSGFGTNIRNAYSNFIQTVFTRPATKLVSGNPVGAVKYYAALAQNLGQAKKDAARAFKSGDVKKIELERIPSGRLPKYLTIPSDAMEAGDIFWQTLIREAEISSGTSPKEAQKIAEYSLFRSNLDPKNKSGQGDLLSAIDALTGRVSKLRDPIKMGKTEIPNPIGWFVPFIKTGTQVAKQWLEFTPGAGLLTLKGHARKDEQIAKQLIGTVPLIIGAHLAIEGKTTWRAPSDPKAKEDFYASGRKPMSIKVGNKWIPMEYFGPLSVALALPAAHNYHFNESPTAYTDDLEDKIRKTLLAGMELYTQQSWMSGLGNFIKLAQGDADYATSQNLGFTAGQIVPFRGLLADVAKLIDPVYRKSQGFGQSFMRDIPFASKQLEPYTTPTGEESTRLTRNSFLPYQVGKADEVFERGFRNRATELKYNRVVSKGNNIKDQARSLFEQGKEEEARALINKNIDVLKQSMMVDAINKEIKKYQGYRKKVINSRLSPQKKRELIALIDNQTQTLIEQTQSLVKTR